MKRIVSGIVVAVMLLAVSGAAFAEEEGAKVSAGLKLWMNSDKHEENGSQTSNNAVQVGPMIEAEFSQVFVEASYMTTATNYKFDQFEVSRNDINVAVGYLFIPNAGVYAGYRIETFKVKDVDSKDTLSGALVGVRGSVPVAGALSVYGDAAYLMLRDKFEGGGVSTTEDSPGFEAELGVKYAFGKELAANLGYKYETAKAKDSGIKDTFTGVTLGAAYTF